MANNSQDFGQKIYDVTVVGLGGHGSSAVAHLAKRGVKVLGIDRFKGVHTFGSSHGQSRIIRQAYFEDPRYVPLLKRSFQLWRELQIEIDQIECNNTINRPPLLKMTGGIMIGYPESTVVKGTLNSVKEHQLPHQILSHKEIIQKYHVFKPLQGEIGILEQEAGVLIPELCCAAHQKVAIYHGANLIYEQIVTKWENIIIGNENLIKVTTANGDKYLTKKLILSVGAWAPELYGHLIKVPLHCERRVLFWFEPPNGVDQFKNIPIYIWDLNTMGNFYGFPYQEGSNGVKIAMHYSQQANNCTPETINRNIEEHEVESMRNLIKQYIPQLNGELVATSTCMYTCTPDDHFLIDFLPDTSNQLEKENYQTSDLSNIIIASPCSGHGFKFCSVIGEILADLATIGNTKFDISFFSINHRNNNS